MQTLAQVIFTIGNNLFAFAVPCLAAFIAYAIADKPGIAPGYAMGVLAGLMKTGFVGGLVGALIAGWFVLQMKKIKFRRHYRELCRLCLFQYFRH